MSASAKAPAPLRPEDKAPTREERAAKGREARERVPRRSHGDWEPSADRPDPIAILEQQAESRVPELVPIRHGRMMVSPFTFYRGAAAIMAADLAGTPDSGLRVQLCGDAHLSNFGAFASPERRLMFDINDFDETLPGPWEWDVKRLVASLAVGARSNGFSEQERETLLLAATRSYREAMTDLAATGTLAVWYSALTVDEALAEFRGHIDRRKAEKTSKARTKEQQVTLARAEKNIAKARTRDHLDSFRKLTHVVDGRLRIVSEPPVVVPVDELFPTLEAAQFAEIISNFLEIYGATLITDRRHLLREFRVVDLARKVVGVGSVGTRAWIALMLGVDEEPLFLQIKEAQASVLEPYLGASEHAQHGERVVAGQRVMQASGDIFLGWHHLQAPDGVEREFYVRQLKDWKGSALVDEMGPHAMTFYGSLCAKTLARAHARSGERVAIAAYLGGGDSFDRAIARFAEAYADQNERDYKALVDAVGEGRIEAQEGV
jgi:uncharacterized protein (DUF2252 family)